MHAIRVPDDLWGAALARAADRGETVSDVVRRALLAYIADGAQPPVGPLTGGELPTQLSDHPVPQGQPLEEDRHNITVGGGAAGRQ